MWALLFLTLLITSTPAASQEDIRYFIGIATAESKSEATSISNETTRPSKIIKWYDKDIWIVAIGPVDIDESKKIEQEILRATGLRGGVTKLAFPISYVSKSINDLNAKYQHKLEPTGDGAARQEKISQSQIAQNHLNLASYKEKIRPIRKKDYEILNISKRPDGFIEHARVIDMNSSAFSANDPTEYVEADMYSGTLGFGAEIDAAKLKKERVRIRCHENFSRACAKAFENHIKTIAISDNLDDYQAILDPSRLINYAQIPPHIRVSSLLNKWIVAGSFGNGFYYDISAFLKIDQLLELSKSDPDFTNEIKDFQKEWVAVRVQFASLITHVAAVTGTSIDHVFNYLGAADGTLSTSPYSPFKSKNIEYTELAIKDMRAYWYNNFGKMKKTTNKPSHFPHSYAPERFAKEYLLGQLIKYNSRLSALKEIREAINFGMSEKGGANLKEAPFPKEVPKNNSRREPKELRPTDKYCDKVSSMSRGLRNFVSETINADPSSISLLKATSAGKEGCNIVVDTDKGVRSCVGGAVYSDGDGFWVHGICGKFK